MLARTCLPLSHSLGPSIALVCIQNRAPRLVFHLKCKVTLYIYSACVFWVCMPIAFVSVSIFCVPRLQVSTCDSVFVECIEFIGSVPVSYMSLCGNLLTCRAGRLNLALATQRSSQSERSVSLVATPLEINIGPHCSVACTLLSCIVF